MRRLGCVMWVAAALVIGCGDDGEAVKADLGGPSVDSNTTGSDAGKPLPDTATPLPDTGSPGAEAGPHQDLGSDARVRDPRIMSDPNPDAVACGKVSCKPSKGEVCCVTMFGMSCKAASACTGLAAPAACDGPEDCPGGQHCCVGFPGGAKCSAAACSGQSQELCNYEDDCPQHCTACKGPGSNLVYGLCTTGTSCPSPYVSP